MKKLKIIIEILGILIIFAGGCYLIYKFVHKIEKEKIDTSYMWNLKYQNMKVKRGSKEGKLKETKDGIELNVTLKEPKEFYEVSFEIENYGSLDAYISNIKKEVTSTDNILKSTITYFDGEEIHKGDKINSKSKKRFKLRIDYPKQKEKIYKELNLKLNFSLEFKADY